MLLDLQERAEGLRKNIRGRKYSTEIDTFEKTYSFMGNTGDVEICATKEYLQFIF